MNELGDESAENDEIRRIREQYEEEWRVLEQERAFVGMEMERVSSVYVECLTFLSNRDFHSLSARLSVERLQFSQLDLTEEKIGDAFVPQLITLIIHGRRLDAKFERMSAEIETAQTCHRCGGLGIIEKESHYERDGGRAIPVRKVDDCALCGGLGRIWLRKGKSEERSA
jgi:hypothetical protein